MILYDGLLDEADKSFNIHGMLADQSTASKPQYCVTYNNDESFHLTDISKEKEKEDANDTTSSMYSYNKFFLSESSIRVRDDREPFREHILGVVLRLQAL